MITVGMNYNVIAGKGPEFESVLSKVLEIMQAMAVDNVDTLMGEDLARRVRA